jgi:uncharacterized protein YcfJ
VIVENARVRSAVPVYSEVQVPRTECTTQTVVTEKPASAEKPNMVGVGLGAVAGGLLGHTVGGVGNEVANRSANAKAERVPTEVQSCKTVNVTQTRLMGHRVRYEYGGREFESIVRGNPGKTLPVRVSVMPVDAQ